jgi:hypothetical protein
LATEVAEAGADLIGVRLKHFLASLNMEISNCQASPFDFVVTGAKPFSK